MKTVTLKLTSAIAVAGQVVKPPSLVEVTEGEAKDLLNRGKAVLATEADQEEPIAARTLSADVEPNEAVVEFNADQDQVAADAIAEAGQEAPPPKRRK